MSEETARQFMRRGVGRRPTSQAFRGHAIGREFRREATFRQIKDAWRTRAWWRDSSWWPIFIGLLATFLIACGMFGFFVVIGPPLVKVLCAGAVVYAAVRTGWGFWKA